MKYYFVAVCNEETEEFHDEFRCFKKETAIDIFNKLIKKYNGKVNKCNNPRTGYAGKYKIKYIPMNITYAVISGNQARIVKRKPTRLLENEVLFQYPTSFVEDVGYTL